MKQSELFGKNALVNPQNKNISQINSKPKEIDTEFNPDKAMELFKLRKKTGKETYILSLDSMKCLICNRSSTSPVHIEARYCLNCDIFHE
jgi:hypothetical protein